jgi:3-oxoacyl-[acyl-carrier protein] reductase
MSRIVLITGGTRGIGAAIVERFLAGGDRVWFTGRSPGSVAAAQGRFGPQARGRVCDSADFSAANALLDELLEAEGRVDVLINNAGLTRDTLAMRMSEEAWDEVLAANLKGVFNMVRHALKPMTRQRSGVILNLSSVVGISGNPGQLNYTAAKAGVIGLTKTLALELGSRQVRVNAVAPGFIETDMTAELPPAAREALQARIPLGRTGRAEEVAALCWFLASDGAAYITGQTIQIDGGLRT